MSRKGAAMPHVIYAPAGEKDLPRLRKYVSERAKIIPRRVTGTCAFHQRELTVAIKRARYMALMPYVSD
jgi:small subunit ribosomal protein S18